CRRTMRMTAAPRVPSIMVQMGQMRPRQLGDLVGLVEAVDAPAGVAKIGVPGVDVVGDLPARERFGLEAVDEGEDGDLRLQGQLRMANQIPVQELAVLLARSAPPCDGANPYCGGACPLCSDFQVCNAPSNCASGHCQVPTGACFGASPPSLCIPAHCFDGVKD